MRSRSTEMELLDEMGLETVWVARKHPFLVYLFLGIFPLVFSDPILLSLYEILKGHYCDIIVE